MRQAGRAMPGYRALRRRYSFLELCRTPELALQVALEPVERLGVDAAIVFSDILIVGEAMGLSLELDDRGAPRLAGLEPTAAGVARLRTFDPSEETRFVLEAIELLARSVGRERAVIGFAAAPWTLACYMLARHPTENPATDARRLLHADPALLAGCSNALPWPRLATCVHRSLPGPMRSSCSIPGRANFPSNSTSGLRGRPRCACSKNWLRARCR